MFFADYQKHKETLQEEVPPCSKLQALNVTLCVCVCVQENKCHCISLTDRTGKKNPEKNEHNKNECGNNLEELRVI
jgi:hypothetical protein